MPRIPTPEANVLKACLDILAAHRIWHERRNTGAVREGKRFVRFGRPGTADILAAPVIRMKWLHTCGVAINDSSRDFLWIECKAERGRQSPNQLQFQVEVEAQGHYYLIVRKPEDLLTWLREHGVIK